MTAWVAQQRPDVNTAISIAAGLGYRALPRRVTRLVKNSLLILPNMRQWWDSEKKDAPGEIWYGHPHRYTRSLMHVLHLGHQVFRFASNTPPRAGKVWMVINDHDEAVDNVMLQDLVETWKKTGATNVSTYHFPDSLGLPHDCISIERKEGKPKIVYPVLMNMVEGIPIK